jgi:hypothetical protein
MPVFCVARIATGSSWWACVLLVFALGDL